MISRVKGILLTKSEHSPKGAYFVVDVQGLGFEVATSIRSIATAPPINTEVCLFTAMIVREDAISLVGFNTHEERDLFQILNSAQGVGPKVALAILSALSVPEIAQAVMSGDHKTLTAAKGVGPKLAQKIVVDLKEKMLQWRKQDNTPDWQYGPSGLTEAQGSRPQGQAWLEAENVLLSLGYSAQEINRCFSSKSEALQEADAERILQEALRWLAQTAF